MVMSQRTRELMIQRAMEKEAERQRKHDTFVRRAKKFAKISLLSAGAAIAGVFGAKALGEKLSQKEDETKNTEQRFVAANPNHGKRLVRHEFVERTVENDSTTVIERGIVSPRQVVYQETATPTGAYYTEVEQPVQQQTTVIEEEPSFGQEIVGNIVSAGLGMLFSGRDYDNRYGDVPPPPPPRFDRSPRPMPRGCAPAPRPAPRCSAPVRCSPAPKCSAPVRCTPAPRQKCAPAPKGKCGTSVYTPARACVPKCAPTPKRSAPVKCTTSQKGYHVKSSSCHINQTLSRGSQRGGSYRSSGSHQKSGSSHSGGHSRSSGSSRGSGRH